MMTNDDDCSDLDDSGSEADSVDAELDVEDYSGSGSAAANSYMYNH